MTTAQWNQAIEIISKSNSCKASFNVPISDNYSNVHSILIHECNAATVKELVSNGYSLYMTAKGLSIDNHNTEANQKYCITIMKTMDISANKLLDSTIKHITSYSETYRDIRVSPAEHLYSEDDIKEGIENADKETAAEINAIFQLLADNDCSYLRIIY